MDIWIFLNLLSIVVSFISIGLVSNVYENPSKFTIYPSVVGLDPNVTKLIILDPSTGGGVQFKDADDFFREDVPVLQMDDEYRVMVDARHGKSKHTPV